MTLRYLRDLVVDDTIAYVSIVVLVCRIAEDRTDRVDHRIEITLAVDDRIFVLADRDTFSPFGSRIDGQVQAVDTVGVVHCLVAVFILFRLADSMLQVIVRMIGGTVQPMEGQRRL